jgi:hypothetical protein
VTFDEDLVRTGTLVNNAGTGVIGTTDPVTDSSGNSLAINVGEYSYATGFGPARLFVSRSPTDTDGSRWLVEMKYAAEEVTRVTFGVQPQDPAQVPSFEGCADGSPPDPYTNLCHDPNDVLMGPTVNAPNGPSTPSFTVGPHSQVPADFPGNPPMGISAALDDVLYVTVEGELVAQGPMTTGTTLNSLAAPGAEPTRVKLGVVNVTPGDPDLPPRVTLEGAQAVAGENPIQRADGTPVVLNTDLAFFGTGEPAPDVDQDTVSDDSDNCVYKPNPVQLDLGSVGVGSDRDDIGDLCQCGEGERDGTIEDPGDAQQLLKVLAGFDAPMSDPDVKKRCSVAAGGSGDPDDCDIKDVVLVKLAAQNPGASALTQHCPNATVNQAGSQ